MRGYYEIRTKPVQRTGKLEYKVIPMINGKPDPNGISYWDHLDEAIGYVQHSYRSRGAACNIIDVERGLRVTNEIELED